MSIERDIAERKAALRKKQEQVKGYAAKNKRITEEEKSQKLLEARLNPQNIETTEIITRAMDDERIREAIFAIWSRDYRLPDVPMTIVKRSPEITADDVTPGAIEVLGEIKNFPIPDQQFPLYEPLMFSVNDGRLALPRHVLIQAVYEDNETIQKTRAINSVDEFYKNVVEFLARKYVGTPITGTPMLDIFDIEYE